MNQVQSDQADIIASSKSSKIEKSSSLKKRKLESKDMSSKTTDNGSLKKRRNVIESDDEDFVIGSGSKTDSIVISDSD